jgi:peptide/nickel transport system substrate-binding protein
MCTGDGGAWVNFPKHYLQQFHKSYNTENLDQLIKDAGAADWVELFRMKGGAIPGTPYNAIWANAELPRMHGWMIVEPYGDTTRVVARRNPYYFKVDPAGNQLPYIDEVTYDVMQDNEVLLLKAANGEIDFTERHINTNVNKPVLADALEKANIRFFDTIPSDMNNVAIALNLTHKDPVTREIFQNIDFRIGLSHAINRQEIIDTVFVGQDEPWQLAPRRDLPFYNEKLAKQYTEYDVNVANQKLDSVLPDKDGGGMRLRPDGEKLVIQIEVAATGQVQIDSASLIVDYWKAVGVDAVVKTEDRALLFARTDTNDTDCAIWSGDGGFKDAMFDSFWYFPQSSDSFFAEAWAIWYSNPPDPGTPPEEPPAAARQQMDLYNQLKATSDPDKQNELFAQILDIAQQQFWAMGVNLPGRGYGFCKKNMRNVPEVMPESALYVTPGPTNPQLYFYE